MSVTPVPGTNAVVATGGTAAQAVPANPNGGFIQNPLLASDQGLATAEVLYVNPIGAAGTAAYGTTFAIQPGQRWDVVGTQTTATSVNAASGGHRFSVVYW